MEKQDIILHVDHMTKCFGDLKVLNDISFDVHYFFDFGRNFSHTYIIWHINCFKESISEQSVCNIGN